MIDVTLVEYPSDCDAYCCAEVRRDGSFEGRLVLFKAGDGPVVYRWHDIGHHLTLEAMQPAYHAVEAYERAHGLVPAEVN